MNLYDRWIARLRRNEDKQGHNRLGDAVSGFCCLGLLADEAGLRPVAGYFPAEDAYSQNGASPPNAVVKEAGLTWQDVYQCVRWNDRERFSFPEIADKLEERKQA